MSLCVEVLLQSNTWHMSGLRGVWPSPSSIILHRFKERKCTPTPSHLLFSFRLVNSLKKDEFSWFSVHVSF